jgi:hypothetical protein
VAVAKHEGESEDATVTSATATAEAGKVSDTNTGYRCSSGRLLNIKLIGSFPHIVTTGHAVDLRSPGPPAAFTVHAVLLTADAASGHTCLIGVQTGNVEPDPGATVLAIE